MRTNNIVDGSVSKERNFKGVWIPAKLYLSGLFSPNEKFVLLEIYSLSKKNGCYATNKHFADFIGLKENTIQKMMLEFEKSGYIKRIFEYKENSREIKNRIIILTQKFLDEFINEKSESENEYPHGKKSIGGMEKNPEGDGKKVGDKYNNISNTDISNTLKTKYAFPSEKCDAVTDKFSREYISKTINNIMVFQFGLGENSNQSKELTNIILYFLDQYEKKFRKKHPNISFISYVNIIKEYLHPFGENMAYIDDLETYQALIDKYFEENYNAYGNYGEEIKLSLSHFMSGEIREHLCNREGVFWERCDD
nr:MAG TPA: helix-turn-helix domain protein [Herelleviridae sp.]